MKRRQACMAGWMTMALLCLSISVPVRMDGAQGWCTQKLSQANDALEKAEATYGADDHRIVDTLLAAADAHALAQDYEAAKEAYARAARLQEKGLKEINEDLLDRMRKRIVAFNGLGATCLELRQFEEAEKAYNHALASARLVLPPNSREVKVSRTGFSLARAYFMRFESAESFYEQLLESCENAFGKEDTEVCRVLQAQVDLYKAMQNLSAAEDTARRLVRLRIAIMPSNHPATATAMNKLASILYEEQRYAEGLPLLEEALRIRRNAFGDHHLNVAISMNNIAALLREMGNEEEAETYEAAARKMIQEETTE